MPRFHVKPWRGHDLVIYVCSKTGRLKVFYPIGLHCVFNVCFLFVCKIETLQEFRVIGPKLQFKTTVNSLRFFVLLSFQTSRNWFTFIILRVFFISKVITYQGKQHTLLTRNVFLVEKSNPTQMGARWRANVFIKVPLMRARLRCKIKTRWHNFFDITAEEIQPIFQCGKQFCCFLKSIKIATKFKRID